MIDWTRDGVGTMWSVFAYQSHGLDNLFTIHNLPVPLVPAGIVEAAALVVLLICIAILANV